MSDEPLNVGRQGIRYVLVGGSSAIGELALFQICYALFGMGPIWSNVIAFVVANVYSFLMNRNFTFKSTSNPARSLVLYCLLFAFNTAVTTALIAWLVQVGVYPLIAKFITMCCVVLWNFVLYRKVVFK